MVQQLQIELLSRKELSESGVELTPPTNDVSKRVLDVSKKALVKTISVSASTAVASAYVVGGVALIGACSTIPVAAVYTLGIIGLVALFATPPGWFAAGGLLGVFITTAVLYLAYKLCITALQSYLTPKKEEHPNIMKKNPSLVKSLREIESSTNKTFLRELLIGPFRDLLYIPRLLYHIGYSFFNPKDQALPAFNVKTHAINNLMGMSPHIITNTRTEEPRPSEQFSDYDEFNDDVELRSSDLTSVSDGDIELRSSGKFNAGNRVSFGREPYNPNDYLS